MLSERSSHQTGGPLQLSSPVLDQLQPPSLQAGRAVRGCAGAVLETGLAELATAGTPLRERRPSDVELRRNVRDRTATLEDLVNRALPSDSRERGITVGHGTGLLPADEWLQHHPSCRSGARSFIPTPVTTTS